MIQVNVTRQKLCLEDLFTGVGHVTQTRGGQPVTLTKINAANLPFDEAQTFAEVVADVNAKIAQLEAMQEQIDAILEVHALLQALSVNINDLAAWLAIGSNQLSAFQPFLQTVDEDQVLADNLNYAMLEQTVIEEDVTITLGTNTHLYVMKGDEYV